MQVVVGKGPIGLAIAQLLAASHVDVRLISRTPTEARPGITPVTLDAADPAALRDACRAAEVIYNCAGPAYHRWTTDWPPLADSLLAAASNIGAVLVTTSNLYGYGPADRPFTEDMPLATAGPKGRVRVRMWQQALAEHEAGRVRVTEARASDYFGPGVTLGYLAGRMMPRLLAGRPVRVLGDPAAPHAWTYVPDIAKALVRLGADERAWGKAWHVPTAPAFSLRDAVERACAILDRPVVRVTSMPWPMLTALGVVVPPLRGISEIRYQFDRPFLVDSTCYTSTFGEQPTATTEALTETVNWWRTRPKSA